MTDGSITFTTALDNKQLEKELMKTKKEIEKLELSTADHEKKKSPLVQQAQELEQKMKEARAEVLKYRADWAAGVAGADKNQSSAIARTQELEAAHAKVVAQIDKVDAKLYPAYEKLDAMKDKAGGIEKELVKAGKGANRMGLAVDTAGMYMDRFVNRVKGLARRVLVFSVITAGLRQLRTWMSKVIKTNDEATSAMARLKGALLTLAQPLVSFVIPAFTVFANILAQIVWALADAASALFGSTAEDSSEAAENLYDETEALDETGKAAKKAAKSLAGFDEINKLSDNATASNQSGTIKPDFSKGDKNWLGTMLGEAAGWVAGAIMLGGIALVAIGAATGSITKVVTGLVLLGVGLVIASETGVLNSWVETLGLNSITEFVVLAVLLGGIAIVALGAAFGNILMVIAGLGLLGATVYYTEKSGIMQEWKDSLGLDKAAQYITAALLIGGMALVVIGAITQNVLMVLAGIGLLAAGIYVGKSSGTFDNWWNALHLTEAAKWITAALIIGGIAFVVFGILLKNILMVISGIGMVAAGIQVGQKTGLIPGENWWDVLGLPSVQGWITAALLVGGIALTVFGILLKNIPMFLGGLAMLFAGVNYGEETGTFDNWWSILGLEQADGWITAALMIGGMALIIFGIIMTNILLIIGGLALLAVGVVYGDTTGTSQNWAEALGLPEVAGWVSTAIIMAGMALIAIGAIMFNPLMVIAGLGLLGVGAISKTFGSSAKGSSGITMPVTASVAEYQIPHLAKGAVIPPNREFMAVLGDQKSGTNIEAPVSEIEAAVARGVARAGAQKNGVIEIKLIVSTKPGMAREMKFELDRETQRQGVKLVQGV